MNKALRKTVIAGNWKMNNTRAETRELIGALAPLVKDAASDVIICVPYTNLETALDAANGTNIQVAAQNCHWTDRGAFTGEISAEMLFEAGIKTVLVGHSERRQYFGETDITVNGRVRAALDAGLRVILCVGEVLEQREQEITEEILSLQIKIALTDVSADELSGVIIAYEPVWAIGTGKTATADQAGHACKFIRSVIAQLYTPAVADSITIQYGGSMNAANAKELLSQEDVDGGLIGGASLKAADFAEIVTTAG